MVEANPDTPTGQMTLMIGAARRPYNLSKNGWSDVRLASGAGREIQIRTGFLWHRHLFDRGRHGP
jgi:hypothetical protein